MKPEWEIQYDAVIAKVAEMDAKIVAFTKAPGYVTMNCWAGTRMTNERDELQKKAWKIMGAAMQHPPRPNTLWWIDRIWAKNPDLVAAMEKAGV